MAEVCDGIKDESVCSVSDRGECVIVGELFVSVINVWVDFVDSFTIDLFIM